MYAYCFCDSSLSCSYSVNRTEVHKNLFAAQKKKLGLLTTKLKRQYAGHVIVKNLQREEAKLNYLKANEELYNHHGKLQFFSALSFGHDEILLECWILSVAVVWRNKVANGNNDLGECPKAFLQYTNQFSHP